jgi:hypothetical protein
MSLSGEFDERKRPEGVAVLPGFRVIKGLLLIDARSKLIVYDMLNNQGKTSCNASKQRSTHRGRAQPVPGWRV